MARRLARRTLADDPRTVAPRLLGCTLVHDHPDGVRSGVIVEVEAYAGAEDPAAHTFRGPTPRNAAMFGRAGTLYVYRSYGIHWCANVVCGDQDGTAVLVRALAPVDGVEAMHAARGPAARRARDLASGPGKLCQALGITGDHDGTDLLDGSGPVRLLDRRRPPEGVVRTTRIGISVAVDEPWRWYVGGDPNVSRR